MDVVIVLLLLGVSVGMFGLFIWGQTGGVVKQQLEAVTAHTDVVTGIARQLGFEEPEVRVDWPKNIGDPPQQAIALDRTDQRLAFGYLEEDVWTLWEVDPSDILSVEVLFDGETVTRVSRSSQATGTVAGALLAGGAGAIIGGLSSGIRSVEQVSRVSIQFLLDMPEVPVMEFCFWDRTSTKTPGGSWKNLSDEAVRSVVGSAKRWILLLQEYLTHHSQTAPTSSPEVDD